MLRVADLTLDPMTRQVRRGERPIELTRKEYALLRYLMENAGAVLSRSQILNNNWGYGFDPGTKVVDVYVRYLRRKVDEGEAVAADPDRARRRLQHRRRLTSVARSRRPRRNGCTAVPAGIISRGKTPWSRFPLLHLLRPNTLARISHRDRSEGHDG